MIMAKIASIDWNVLSALFEYVYNENSYIKVLPYLEISILGASLSFSSIHPLI